MAEALSPDRVMVKIITPLHVCAAGGSVTLGKAGRGLGAKLGCAPPIGEVGSPCTCTRRSKPPVRSAHPVDDLVRHRDHGQGSLAPSPCIAALSRRSWPAAAMSERGGRI